MSVVHLLRHFQWNLVIVLMKTVFFIFFFSCGFFSKHWNFSHSRSFIGCVCMLECIFEHMWEYTIFFRMLNGCNYIHFIMWIFNWPQCAEERFSLAILIIGFLLVQFFVIAIFHIESFNFGYICIQKSV